MNTVWPGYEYGPGNIPSFDVILPFTPGQLYLGMSKNFPVGDWESVEFPVSEMTGFNDWEFFVTCFRPVLSQKAKRWSRPLNESFDMLYTHHDDESQ